MKFLLIASIMASAVGTTAMAADTRSAETSASADKTRGVFLTCAGTPGKEKALFKDGDGRLYYDTKDTRCSA